MPHPSAWATIFQHDTVAEPRWKRRFPSSNGLRLPKPRFQCRLSISRTPSAVRGGESARSLSPAATNKQKPIAPRVTGHPPCPCAREGWAVMPSTKRKQATRRCQRASLHQTVPSDSSLLGHRLPVWLEIQSAGPPDETQVGMHMIDCIRAFLQGDAPGDVKDWVGRGLSNIYQAATATTTLLKAGRRGKHLVRRKRTTQ